MNERERSQKILDIMFEVLSRVHAGDRVPKDRDECMSWARSQLIKCGVDVFPRGMSHASLGPR
jgi:hypothetical protein